MAVKFGAKEIAIATALLVAVVAAAGAVIWRDDIISTTLDPKQPFQTYDPPPAPNYAARGSWAHLPPDPDSWTEADGPADIFFIHPTTFDGGRDWNGSIADRRAASLLSRTYIPNYAGPFQQVGRVFAPRYRQAGLYSFLTNRDDARDARAFAYADVEAAFRYFRVRLNRGRPIVIVGVEQGGQLADLLVHRLAAEDPELIQRLAAVYIIDAVIPADEHTPTSPLPACTQRAEARCVVAYEAVPERDDDDADRLLQRALVWNASGRLESLAGRPALCVNPVTGAVNTVAGQRANLGAANATGMEWGARPAFLPRQVSAACEGGLLRISDPTSPALRLSRAWTDRRKAAPYNLFYADLEADAKARVATLLGRSDLPQSAPSIESAVTIGDAPIRRID